MEKRIFSDRVILFDKAAGITSYAAIEEAGRALGVKKIGHSGTLDKAASGLLVICTGKATKLTRFFLESDKRYRGVIKLGVVTDTGDVEGSVVATRSTEGVTHEMISGIVQKFSGSIEQVPPRYSALKIQGKRASDLARRGMDVPLEKRRVEIKKLDITGVDLASMTISMDVHCSKGTYIRSLAADIGDYLNTGAHLLGLRRIRSGDFSVDDAVTIEEIRECARGGGVSKNFVLDPVDALSSFGRVMVKDEALKKAANGAQFNQSDIMGMELKAGKPTVITDGRKNIIAIADIDGDNWSIDYLNVFV